MIDAGPSPHPGGVPPRSSRAGKDCPACDRDIGVWAVFSAGLPHRIRCPGCRHRLYYEKAGRVITVYVAIWALVIAGTMFAIRPWSTSDQLIKRSLLCFGTVFFIGSVVELLTVLHLRHRHSLALVARPTVEE